MLQDDEFRGFLKTLGTRIKHLRKEKQISMRDIMISTGYYDAQWRKYEAGGSLTVASLLKIALALNVSLSVLFDGLGQWPEKSIAEIQAQHGIRPEPEPDDHEDLHLEPESELTAGKGKKSSAHKSKPTKAPDPGSRTIRAGTARRKSTVLQ